MVTTPTYLVVRVVQETEPHALALIFADLFDYTRIACHRSLESLIEAGLVEITKRIQQARGHADGFERRESEQGT